MASKKLLDAAVPASVRRRARGPAGGAAPSPAPPTYQYTGRTSKPRPTGRAPLRWRTAHGADRRQFFIVHETPPSWQGLLGDRHVTEGLAVVRQGRRRRRNRNQAGGGSRSAITLTTVAAGVVRPALRSLRGWSAMRSTTWAARPPVGHAEYSSSSCRCPSSIARPPARTVIGTAPPRPRPAAYATSTVTAALDTRRGSVANTVDRRCACGVRRGRVATVRGIRLEVRIPRRPRRRAAGNGTSRPFTREADLRWRAGAKRVGQVHAVAPSGRVTAEQSAPRPALLRQPRGRRAASGRQPHRELPMPGQQPASHSGRGVPPGARRPSGPSRSVRRPVSALGAWPRSDEHVQRIAAGADHRRVQRCNVETSAADVVLNGPAPAASAVHSTRRRSSRRVAAHQHQHPGRVRSSRRCNRAPAVARVRCRGRSETVARDRAGAEAQATAPGPRAASARPRSRLGRQQGWRRRLRLQHSEAEINSRR